MLQSYYQTYHRLKRLVAEECVLTAENSTRWERCSERRARYTARVLHGEFEKDRLFRSVYTRVLDANSDGEIRLNAEVAADDHYDYGQL